MSQSESIYELGKKLVLELDLENEVDTLARWMAHHIAGLIQDAESATGKAKTQKASDCREAIIELWKVRHELPNGKRPFESFEEVFRALERLDPENKTPRYFISGRPSTTKKDRLSEYLELIEGLDYTARVLIEFALAEAVYLSKGAVRDWIIAAQKDVEEGQDIAVAGKIVFISDDLEDENPQGKHREMLEDRLKRLEHFQSMASVAIGSLKHRLKVPAPKPLPKTSKTKPKPKPVKKAKKKAPAVKKKAKPLRR